MVMKNADIYNEKVKLLRAVADECVDLLVADEPPFNIATRGDDRIGDEFFYTHLVALHKWSGWDIMSEVLKDFGSEFLGELHDAEHEDSTAFLQDPMFPEANKIAHTH